MLKIITKGTRPVLWEPSVPTVGMDCLRVAVKRKEPSVDLTGGCTGWPEVSCEDWESRKKAGREQYISCPGELVAYENLSVARTKFCRR